MVAWNETAELQKIRKVQIQFKIVNINSLSLVPLRTIKEASSLCSDNAAKMSRSLEFDLFDLAMAPFRAIRSAHNGQSHKSVFV